MTFELKRWLQCPECGADVRCYAYHTSFDVECIECEQRVKIEVGERPLHNLSTEQINRQDPLRTTDDVVEFDQESR